ncbi:HAD family hydrolase [Nonomuraea pusilla]|uniref:HAD family hydrolase n=1 Tax=Nonomuraea pusilla TaxID=46177 RepID=UPI00191C63A5|nr:HAD family hydrolase [Nonomuraea pusilla]
MTPRIVATDLDGTLLSSTGAITPRTRDALGRAASGGAEIVFVTARPPRAVRAVAVQAGVAGTAICSNGAILYDLATGDVAAAHTLAPDLGARIAETLATALPGVAFAVETGWEVLAEARYTLHQEDLFRRVPSACGAGEPIVKLLARSAAHTSDEMLAAATAAVGGLAEITHSGVAGLLEISAAGVTKAGTLGRLCAERGVAPHEVVAFGDMPNDLAVLAFAGAGYAMANAHHLVLAGAAFRTLSNDEDGVAVVLERLFG